jgi:transposase
MTDRIGQGGSGPRRLSILELLTEGSITPNEAASLLGISERHVRRLLAAYSERGEVAVVHGNLGRRPANALDEKVSLRVVTLATTMYAGFNQHHLTEMLAEHEGIVLSRSTVRRILTTAGIPAPRRRRPPRHRQRRDRYAREGMLLQVDGSRHDWLEGRGPYLSLVGAIDDATGKVPSARFREQEDAQGYFQMMRQVVQRHGIPLSLYSDMHSIFYVAKKEMTIEEQFAGRREPTQFGRLLEELGTTLILARSPQAKGRVERLWGTFQDRLTSELRLANAETADDAEIVLARYLPRHNRRFAIPAADPQLAWMPWPATLRLDEVFCFKYRRTVANDNTVSFGNQIIDIPPNSAHISLRKARVDVHQRFDGDLRVYYKGTCLAKTALVEPPSNYRANIRPTKPIPRVMPEPVLGPPAPRKGHPPAANHPWKRGYPGQSP